MPDVVRVVTKQKGFGGRLADSIKGIFFGFILFLAAFPLLWWGEGRQNLAEFVQKATAAEAKGTPVVTESPLIKVTGTVSSDQSVTDPEFLSGTTRENVLQLERNAQMYAWDEDVKTEKEGDNEVKTYTYTKKWTSWPDDSSGFNAPQGHENPPMPVKDDSFRVQTARVGELEFDAANAEFYKLGDMKLERERVLPRSAGRQTVLGNGGKFIFLPLTAGRNPEADQQVGDIRISYDYYPAGKVGTVVGDWDGGRIVPHVYRKTGTFLGVFPGSAEHFAAHLESEHRMVTWLIRIGSLLMMWIGMNMVLGPLLLVMERVPILGAVGRGIIGIVTGVLAFVLWLLTLILANLWLVLLVIAALVTIAVIVAKRKKKEAATAQAA